MIASVGCSMVGIGDGVDAHVAPAMPCQGLHLLSDLVVDLVGCVPAAYP